MVMLVPEFQGSYNNLHMLYAACPAAHQNISFWLGSARQTMSCTATARLEDLLLSVLVFAELMTSDDPSDCMSFHVFSVFLFELSINQAQEQKTGKKHKQVQGSHGLRP